MRLFPSKLIQHLTGSVDLNASQILALLLPARRSTQLDRHTAEIILQRTRLIAAVFAVLVPLCSIIDFVVFPLPEALHLLGLRLASAAIFVALAWPREMHPVRYYPQALVSLLVLLLVPPLFHLFSVAPLAVSASTPVQLLVAQLYGYLPTIVLGGLAIFPLTAIETLLLAVPVLVISVLAGMLGGTAELSLAQIGGTVWFMGMMLGVSMFSGMTQCHYIATLIIKAMQDPLTGAFTRRSGEEALNLMLRLNQMSGKPLTVVFLDLDRFKSINDSFGHEAGDRCLRTLSEALQKGLRRSDMLVRWGGEEFVALLPDTPVDNIPLLLRRLRQTGFGLRPDGTALTASIGVAHSLEDSVSSWAMLIQRADQRMYIAKQNGRDGAVLPDGTHLRLAATPAQPAA